MGEERKAGRELDAEVAEMVMGDAVEREHPMGGRWLVAGPEGWYALPKYSKDIAAAWLVVERLKVLGYYPCVFVDDTGDVDAPVQWRCILDRNWRNDESPFFATAPLAICAAALRASPMVGLESET